MRSIRIDTSISADAVLFAVYCALAPMNMVMNFSGATINKYVGLLVVAVMVLQLLRAKKVHLNMRIVGSLVAYLLWTLVTCLWTIDSNSSHSQIITHLSLAAIFLVGGMRGFNASEIRFIKIAIVLVAAILSFYVMPSVGDDAGSRATLQTSAGIADQNGLAANLIFALWVAIDQLREGKKLLMKGICTIAIVLISYSVLVIASRGALVALITSAFIYFVVFRACKIHPMVIALAVVLCVFVYQYALKVNPIAVSRLSIEKTVADGGAGRSVIWSSVLNLLSEHPIRILVGYGYGCEGAVGRLATGIWKGTHNVYLELLATTGIIGLVLFLFFIMSVFSDSVKRRDHLGIAQVTVFLTVCLVLGFSKDKGAWNMLLLTVVGFDHNQYTTVFRRWC